MPMIDFVFAPDMYFDMQLVLDYDDLTKIPFVNAEIRRISERDEKMGLRLR